MWFWDRFSSKFWCLLQWKRPSLLVCWGKVRFWLQKASIFRWKSIPKSHGESVKNYIFFNLCWKCIIWCWWAWRVYGNVSRALQTRKTIKIASCFGQIHYNSVLNTNVHQLMFIMQCSFWDTPEHRTQNDLPPRLLGFRSCASGMSLPNAATRLHTVHIPVVSCGLAPATFRQN